MAAALFLFIAVDANGSPLSGAKMATKVKDTSTDLPVYTDSGLTTPTTNPAIANSAGIFKVYIDTTKSYDITITNSAGSYTVAQATYTTGDSDPLVFSHLPQSAYDANEQLILDIYDDIAIVAANDVDISVNADNIAAILTVEGAITDGTLGTIVAGLDTKATTGTYSALRAVALANAATLTAFTVIDRGLPVTYRWQTGDQSTPVAADEMTSAQGDGGLWVAPAADKTGASGAWKAVIGQTMQSTLYGTTTAAINKAITAMSSAGGGTVQLPAGTITVSDDDADGTAVLVKDGVTLDAAGRGITRLLLAANQNSTRVVKLAANSSNMGVRNLSVDGNRDNQAAATDSLKGIVGSANCDDVTIKNVGIDNIYGRCLVTNEDELLDAALGDEAEGWTIDDVVCLNGGAKSIQVRRSKRVNVSNCRTLGAGVNDSESDSAFESSRSMYVNFSNCHAEQSVTDLGPSFRVVNDSHFVTIEGGTGKGGRQGVFISDSTDVDVGGIIIDKASENYPGVFIQHADLEGNGWGPVARIKIHDNIIINGGGAGVYVDIDPTHGTACTDIDIFDNTLYDDGANVMDYGIQLDPGAGTITCREWGNTIVNAQVARVLGTFVDMPPLQVESVTTPLAVAQNSYSGKVTIADDGVATITPPSGTDTGFLLITVDTVQAWGVLLAWRAGASQQVLQLAGDSANRVDQTTGTLTGTTGSDTNVTISALANGTLQIENRAGSTRTFCYQFLACT